MLYPCGGSGGPSPSSAYTFGANDGLTRLGAAFVCSVGIWAAGAGWTVRKGSHVQLLAFCTVR